MVEFDVFRQNLATSLLACADRRRACGAGGTPSGEDLKIAARLERLAADVENLDLHVFLIFELMFTQKRLARRFLRQRDDLLAQIGVTTWPENASDLVRWMTRQISSQRLLPPRVQALMSGSRSDQSVGDAPPRGPLLSWASDFSAGLGIVTPMLAIWEVRIGIGQLHDHALMDGHAAVPANVISVDKLAGGGKSTTSPTDVVLAFQPSPSSGPCRVTLRADTSSMSVELGQSLMVVPRSPDCELPLIPSRIGDPLQTFAVAAALLIGGLASLKFWSRLGKRPSRPAAPSVLSSTAIWP